jgi:hypothetical protein
MSEPTIVCLCGSTRFFQQFQEVNYKLTLEGYVVLAPAFFPHSRPVEDRTKLPPLYVIKRWWGRLVPQRVYSLETHGPESYCETFKPIEGESAEAHFQRAVDACWDSYNHLLEGLMPHGEGVGISPEQKKQLDELHLRKVDMADEVFVINVDGYVGESTFNEVVYAVVQGREIRLLEPEHAVALWTRLCVELYENRAWTKDLLFETVPNELKAQVRARLSWIDWTDEEIEEELKHIRDIEEKLKALKES